MRRMRRALLVGVLILVPAQAPADEPPIHACDRLAANAFDHQKVPGIDGIAHFRTIDASRAVAACAAAIEKYPDTARFQYQYGRALAASDDCEKAIPWFRHAADQAHAAAYQALGYAHLIGCGVPKDEREAVYWYRRGANEGNALSQHDLGQAYFFGLGGVRKNREIAFRWILEAAAHGLAEAQYSIGWMYENGIGTAKNSDRAVKWYGEAVKQGHGRARKELAKLQALTAEARREARKTVLDALALTAAGTVVRRNWDVLVNPGPLSDAFKTVVTLAKGRFTDESPQSWIGFVCRAGAFGGAIFPGFSLASPDSSGSKDVFYRFDEDPPARATLTVVGGGDLLRLSEELKRRFLDPHDSVVLRLRSGGRQRTITVPLQGASESVREVRRGCP